MLTNLQNLFSGLLLSNANGLSLEHIERMIVHGLIHGLIYGVIFKLFHDMPLPLTIIIAVIGIGWIWHSFKKRSQ